MPKRPVDPDNPPLTAAELRRLKPFPGDLPPRVATAIRQAYATAQQRRRGQQRAPTKVAVNVRLERDALAAYRATGRGWQSRLSADVSAAAKRLRDR